MNASIDSIIYSSNPMETSSNKGKGTNSKSQEVSGSIYGTTQKVPDKNSVDAIVKTYLNAIHL